MEIDPATRASHQAPTGLDHSAGIGAGIDWLPLFPLVFALMFSAASLFSHGLQAVVCLAAASVNLSLGMTAMAILSRLAEPHTIED